MKVILASNSARRHELMKMAKIEHEIIPSDFDENVDNNLGLEEQSKEIAFQKAKDIFDNTQGDRCIIGSDTLVIFEDKQLGKPKNRQEAIDMIKALQGNLHEVFTSLAILIEEKGEYKEIKEISKTIVSVRAMTDEEIENYVDSEEPYDCAGAYKIQEFFSVFIDRIEGDYPTVIGLPINRVYSILKENNII